MAKKNQTDIKYNQKLMAKRLARLLDEKNINQKQLAEKAGVWHLSQMKAGTRPINWRVFKAIAETPDLGFKALGWILTGAYETDLFSIAKLSTRFIAETKAEPPGSTIRFGPIPDYGVDYETRERCPFRNKELAMRLKEDLAYVEENMPLEYLWLVEKIHGKASIDKFLKKNQEKPT